MAIGLLCETTLSTKHLFNSNKRRIRLQGWLVISEQRRPYRSNITHFHDMFNRPSDRLILLFSDLFISWRINNWIYFTLNLMSLRARYFVFIAAESFLFWNYRNLLSFHVYLPPRHIHRTTDPASPKKFISVFSMITNCPSFSRHLPKSMGPEEFRIYK